MGKNDLTTNIQDLKENVKKITVEHNWEQFHSPKNLAVYLSI